MLVVNPIKRTSITDLLEYPFFNLYDECDFDLFESFFIPEISFTQDIVHSSFPILKNDNFEKLTTFLPASLSFYSFSANFNDAEFNRECFHSVNFLV
jgi:serine/threonine protein kinase